MADDLAKTTVFYSWESDLPAKTTRNLIEGCLNKAIQQLGRDDEVDIDPSLDRDTRNVSGSPVILDAILEKIDNCSAFVADVSIINSGELSRPTPNPNVIMELGYAVKACGWDRVLPVCNEQYGAIDKLPFDIPDRRVIAFTLSENPTPEELAAAKEKLTAIFKLRLKEILKLSRQSILDIQIGDLDTEQLFGQEHDCRLVKCSFSDYPNGRFPKYQRHTSVSSGLQMLEPGLNSDYYSDVAEYTIKKNLTHRFAFAVLNRSDKTLLSPRLEVVIETPESDLLAFDIDSSPKEPNTSIFVGSLPALLERQNRRNFAQLKQGADRTIIRAELENIQAKRTAWSTCVYLGTPADTLILKCRLYADNLKQPFEQQLRLNFSIIEQSRTLKGWIAAGFTATLRDQPTPMEQQP